VTVLLSIALVIAPTGPYDALCSAIAHIKSSTIMAHEAGVPLNKVLEVLVHPDIGASAKDISREIVLEIYSEARNGAPFDESEFINQSTAMCIVRLEREPRAIPEAVPLSGVK
jgi:hypothetical protein